MKYLFLIPILLLSACSSVVLHKAPCDAVMNREDEFVCGDADVLKKCRPVADHPEFVCDKK